MGLSVEIRPAHIWVSQRGPLQGISHEPAHNSTDRRLTSSCYPSLTSACTEFLDSGAITQGALWSHKGLDWVHLLTRARVKDRQALVYRINMKASIISSPEPFDLEWWKGQDMSLSLFAPFLCLQRWLEMLNGSDWPGIDPKLNHLKPELVQTALI